MSVVVTIHEGVVDNNKGSVINNMTGVYPFAKPCGIISQIYSKTRTTVKSENPDYLYDGTLTDLKVYLRGATKVTSVKVLISDPTNGYNFDDGDVVPFTEPALLKVAKDSTGWYVLINNTKNYGDTETPDNKILGDSDYIQVLINFDV